MRYDLKTPCKNCPFRTDETAIRFACRERAEEIEESAYRHGFPCHLSATYTGDDDEDGGFVPKHDGSTQHCVGALIMYLKEGESSTPGTDNDEELFAHVSERVDWNSPVFDSIEAFIDASDPGVSHDQSE